MNNSKTIIRNKQLDVITCTSYTNTSIIPIVTDSQITIITLIATIGLFVWNRFSVGVVPLLAAIFLYLTGVITLQETFSGLGDPAVIFVAGLFVISEALNSSGITSWVGNKIDPIIQKKSQYLTISIILIVTPLAALITSNGAVAAMLPISIVLAVKSRRSPSKILMPLAFAGHAGSLLMLTGSPVNIIANEAMNDTSARAFSFFAFALAGIPIVIGTAIIILAFSSKILPDNDSDAEKYADYGDYKKQLKERYLDAETTIHIKELAKTCQKAAHANTETLISANSGVTEVIIPPNSKLVGTAVFPGMVTNNGDFIILSIQRNGENFGSKTREIQVGDTLLVQGSWEDLQSKRQDPNIILVQDPEEIRQQIAPLGKKAYITIFVMISMIAALATNLIAPAITTVLAAIILIITNVVTVERVHKTMSWSTLILLGGMFAVATAMTKTGISDSIAEKIIDSLGAFGPYAIVFGLCIVVTILGQMISNTATALIIIPIAISIAQDMDISPQPLIMAVVVMAAASFLTPIATPGNVMIMKPGGYKFTDYWKLGLPMLVLYLLVAVFWVPFIWKF